MMQSDSFLSWSQGQRLGFDPLYDFRLDILGFRCLYFPVLRCPCSSSEQVPCAIDSNKEVRQNVPSIFDDNKYFEYRF